MMASQKSGIAMPKLEPSVANRSAHDPGRVPARIPSGTPISNDSRIPPIATLNVTGKRFAISSATGWSRWNHDVPRSPWTASPTQRVYRSKNPSSRWNSCATSATAAGFAVVPPEISRAISFAGLLRR